MMVLILVFGVVPRPPEGAPGRRSNKVAHIHRQMAEPVLAPEAFNCRSPLRSFPAWPRGKLPLLALGAGDAIEGSKEAAEQSGRRWPASGVLPRRWRGSLGKCSRRNALDAAVIRATRRLALHVHHLRLHAGLA